MSRKKLLAGNWKMHKTRAETLQFFSGLREQFPNFLNISAKVDLAFGVPATLFSEALSTTRDTGVKILAQNCHWETQGAFTGELSVGMLRDAGFAGSIIGHSERRQYFAETSEAVGKKWNALALGGLLPVVCVGETKAEREAGQTTEVVRCQIDDALSQVSPEGLAKTFVIAYEPVWAIGTGLTASPDQAQEVHAFIRTQLAEKLSKARASEVTILYGGSMNAANAAELLRKPDIDGGLIGGASLKVDEFSKMVKAALEL